MSLFSRKGKELPDQEAHNNKLMDLCYRRAVRICMRAEFGHDGMCDWSLPSEAEFRRQIREKRAEHYRAEAKK